MSTFADRPLFPKPKVTPQGIQRELRLRTIGLRMAIWQELEAQSITTPDDIGAALGMPAAEALRLLTRHRREGDMAALEAAAARLGIQTLPGWRSRRHIAD